MTGDGGLISCGTTLAVSLLSRELRYEVEPPQRSMLLRRAAEAVAPEGTVLVVGHDLRNLTYGQGGPSDRIVDQVIDLSDRPREAVRTSSAEARVAHRPCVPSRRWSPASPPPAAPAQPRADAIRSDTDEERS